ncbi:dTDP-glucose 4,6-dehydratase [Actinocatenispora rupis]|uniref:dTDP-glucose 4,6-dehydratase n=1 Tax=Actinocatenispora rupis TaxID=519421 RepID=A0A8J3J827_9ACTN|nr:dTDP-glucose 4,6-dehydratase [Actinocatenispora rupis]GID11113.1 dTDP-glucose 4,6-dehydratase [Actinocatenispora rupis]
MRILVTGGAGFIGSTLVRMLLTGALPDHPDTLVTVLDALTYAGRRDNLDPVADSPRLRFVHGDVRDEALVDSVVPGHDAIVHLAAESHVDRSIAAAAPFVSTNVLGTQVILDAALRHRIRRVLCVSTDEVYGSLAHGAWTEDAPLAPRSPYSASKAGADLLALAYHATHGLRVTVTRGANTYGPRQHGEKIVPRFTTRLLAGRTAPLYGDGHHVRDWFHVTDHCRGLDLALRHGRPGRVYHLAGGTELTNAELAARLVRLTGADPALVTPVADRKGHDRRYALDTTRARTELGFTPTVAFDEGLAETVAWYRAHPDRATD